MWPKYSNLLLIMVWMYKFVSSPNLCLIKGCWPWKEAMGAWVFQPPLVSGFWGSCGWPHKKFIRILFKEHKWSSHLRYLTLSNVNHNLVEITDITRGRSGLYTLYIFNFSTKLLLKVCSRCQTYFNKSDIVNKEPFICLLQSFKSIVTE